MNIDRYINVEFLDFSEFVDLLVSPWILKSIMYNQLQHKHVFTPYRLLTKNERLANSDVKVATKFWGDWFGFCVDCYPT